MWTKLLRPLKVKNHDVEEMNIRLSYSDSSIDYQEENGLSQSLRASGAGPMKFYQTIRSSLKLKILLLKR